LITEDHGVCVGTRPRRLVQQVAECPAPRRHPGLDYNRLTGVSPVAGLPVAVGAGDAGFSVNRRGPPFVIQRRCSRDKLRSALTMLGIIIGVDGAHLRVIPGMLATLTA